MAKKINTDEVAFELPDKRVIIKHIPRNKGIAVNLPNNHIISGGMLVNSTKKFTAPLQRNNVVKNVLTDAEKKHLEKVTGLDLSVYGDFWTDFTVTLRKEDSANMLDLLNPMDYISFAVLRSLDKVSIAPSWEDRNKNLDYEFAITYEGDDIISSKKSFSVKAEAFKAYGKIEDNRDLLIVVQRLLSNRPISKDTSLEWVQSEVGQIVDNEPEKFLSVINDTGFHTKVLIYKGIDNGYILKNGNRYSTEDGLELCNAGEIPTLEKAVEFLDEPKNGDIRSLIEAKIEKK